MSKFWESCEKLHVCYTKGSQIMLKLWGWGKIQKTKTVIVVVIIKNVECDNGLSDAVNRWELH